MKYGGGILKSAVGWVEFVLGEIGENYIHVSLFPVTKQGKMARYTHHNQV